MNANILESLAGGRGVTMRALLVGALCGLMSCAGGDAPGSGDDDGGASFGPSTGDAETCGDGLQNGDETDVDCGGASCQGCEVGQGCGSAGDCVDDLVCDPIGATCTPADCGDGVQNGDESDIDCGGTVCSPCTDGSMCFGGADCDSGVCEASACQPPTCGDGIINGDEICDDGGPSDTCSATCQPASCGDGVVDTAAGETCDAGEETASCDANCTSAVCGDGYVNAAAGETCDGAGPSAMCDGDCTAVECGDGVLNSAAGEQCEENGVESATCDIDCTVPQCGDGVPNAAAGETCDTGAASATCDADCTDVACGDGVPNSAAGEQCDTGGASATCDADCTTATCGDGTLNTAAGEQCDDGNTGSNDGCSSTCQDEFPAVCTTSSVGVQSGSNWVVCEANASGAWLSHGTTGTGGIYNALQACQSIGYGSVGAHGGTYGDVCSYGTSGSSCSNPGAKTFTGGGTSCGAGLLCYTVMWECLP